MRLDDVKNPHLEVVKHGDLLCFHEVGIRAISLRYREYDERI